MEYESDSYHVKRRPELINNDELYNAWGSYAEQQYFNRVQPGESIFEFGGGLGNNLISISRKAEVCMLEPSSLGRNVARDHGIEAIKDLSELGDREFDWILCRHVLEHVDHPLTTLLELKERLKSGGCLILIVPLESPTDMPVSEDLNHHLHNWNPRNLSNLVTNAGYQVSRIYFEYYGARRKLLPINRLLGPTAYVRAIRTCGRIFRFREIVCHCINPA